MGVDELNKVERIAFDWQYKMMGSFFANLMSAIQVADMTNLALLRLSFPDHVEAYVKYSREEGWWEAVERKAKGE